MFSVIQKYLKVITATVPKKSDRALIITKSILDSTLPLLEAFLGAKILNSAIASAEQKQVSADVFIFIAVLISVEFTKRLLDLLFGIVSKRIEDEAELNVGMAISEKAYKVEYASYEDPEFLKLADRAERFKYRAGFLTTQIMDRILYPVFSFVSTLIAFLVISKLVALIVVIITIPNLCYRFRFSKAERKLWDDQWSARRKATSYLDLASSRYIKESRVLGLVQFARKRWWELSQKLIISTRKLEVKNEKINILDSTIGTILEYSVLIIVIYRIASGQLEVGYFIFAQALVGRFLGATHSLTSGVSIIDEDIALLADYIKFIELPDEEGPKLDNQQKLLQKPSITVKNLSFSYPQAKINALKDVTLEIPFGKDVAIVGENGAGKTTLVKLILGLYKPTSGSVSVNSHVVADYSSSEWHKKVGVLFQDFNGFNDFTIEDAVWFGDISKPKSASQINAALDKAGALGFVNKLEVGSKTFMNKWVENNDIGVELSGGQYQRIALARAFFRDPDILILDEPTSAIDAKGEYQIFKILEEERKDKTNIFISHRFNTVRKADIIYFVEDGRVVEGGSHQDLIKLGGKYHDLFEKYAKDYR